MAWATKYRCEIDDMYGVSWKIEVEEDAFAGSVTTLVGAGDPILFEWNNDSDDVFDPIKTSRLNLTVWSETNFALIDLYSTEDLHFRVKAYQNTVLFWTGYIITGNYTEPYNDVPYPVTIVASCGLEQLKNALYKYETAEPDDTYYNGRRLESQIVIDILGKLGYTGFTEYINLYEESMDDSTDDSPLDQIKIDVDIFRDMYCYEVLKELLKKYNACIIHKDGGFVLYRPTELTGATVYGRIFTAVITKSSTSFTSVKYINRSGHSSTLRQVPGGALMVQRPAKTINIYQDYGNKESWINNWEFSSNKFSGTIITGINAEEWTRSGGQTIAPINNALIVEANGVLLTNHNNYPTLDHYIYQQFSTNAVISSDALSLEFEFAILNTKGSATSSRYIYIDIISDSTSKWLYNVDLEYCDWDTSTNHVLLSAIPSGIGLNGWYTFKRRIAGIPATDTYTIKIYSLDDDETDVFLAIKNIKFYATSDEITVKKYKESYFPFVWSKWKKRREYKDVEEITQNTYIKTNSINGVDLDYDYILGDVVDANIDNIVEQFAGSLATYVSTVLDYSTDWNTRGGSESKPLLEIIGDEIADQYSRPKQLVQMAILETGTAATALNLIGHYQDILNSNLGFIAQPTLWTSATYEIFTSVGTEITSAINTSGVATCNTDLFAVVDSVDIYICFTMTLNSGTMPTLKLVETGLGDTVIGDAISAGDNIIIIQATTTNDWRIRLETASGVATNFSTSTFGVSYIPRKFVINRAEYSAKNRKFDIDFCEII